MTEAIILPNLFFAYQQLYLSPCSHAVSSLEWFERQGTGKGFFIHRTEVPNHQMNADTGLYRSQG